jgi:phosphoribosylformylglycinamidine (FGAM) synthase-like enzyme
VNEYEGLKKLYRSSPRNPRQLNAFNTSDTEVVQIKKDLFLVTSTDSLAVEIHSELYKHPETWGYLAVANSVSDLSASGAKPVGMLISAQWKNAHSGHVKNQVYNAISKALTKFNIPLLGGDSGSSNETVLTTTILGQASTRPLTRLGIKPGDLVILFGNSLGNGPALAFDYLKYQSRNKWELRFRPTPNWKVTHEFRKYFKASMDTSDGIYNSLVTLARLNNVNFKIDLAQINLSPKLNLYRRQHLIPKQYFIESDLGDLQTCVAIDSKTYTKIKSRLPTHQILARAEKNKTQISCVNYFKNESPVANYMFLTDLLKRNEINYSSSLNLWLKQFSK